MGWIRAPKWEHLIWPKTRTPEMCCLMNYVNFWQSNIGSPVSTLGPIPSNRRFSTICFKANTITILESLYISHVLWSHFWPKNFFFYSFCSTKSLFKYNISLSTVSQWRYATNVLYKNRMIVLMNWIRKICYYTNWHSFLDLP